jgi:selT/selW/selH-like putative selenoprotein
MQFQQLKAYINFEFPGTVLEYDDTSMSIGSFEVYVGSELIYSKLATFSYPSIADLRPKLKEHGYTAIATL